MQDDNTTAENEEGQADSLDAASNDGNGIVVVPAFEKTGNRDTDERLARYRDKLGGKRLPLVRTPNLAPVRAKLVHMLPHLEAVIDRILNAMVPHTYVTLPPVLLIGRPGCGKTTLLEELANRPRHAIADSRLRRNIGREHSWAKSPLVERAALAFTWT